MKRNYREEDLYPLVRAHFEALGYRVRAEVHSCDVVALKQDSVVVLELKKSLSLELLLQAVKRQKIADLTYICVPKPKRFTKNRSYQDLLFLLKRLSLGLIFCEPDRDHLEIMLHPQELDLNKTRSAHRGKRQRLIAELNGRTTSLNQGGSRGKKLMTSYKEEALKVLWLCGTKETLAPKEGVAHGLKKAPSILRDNYYQWFTRVSRGVYALSKTGQSALLEHQETLCYLLEEDPCLWREAIGEEAPMA
ncbi:hypothetical protein ABB02_01918 [Clostridiaceae bacterium JG1575]|nr:hypothetical protein ABB02_01918 [Clostridiaceae bacterium JG1575]